MSLEALRESIACLHVTTSKDIAAPRIRDAEQRFNTRRLKATSPRDKDGERDPGEQRGGNGCEAKDNTASLQELSHGHVCAANEIKSARLREEEEEEEDVFGCEPRPVTWKSCTKRATCHGLM